jgi:Ion transport protein
MSNEGQVKMTQETIHVDVKGDQSDVPGGRQQQEGNKIMCSQRSPRNSVLPSLSRRKRQSRQKLSFFPTIVDVGFFSKISGHPQSESNLSESTGDDTVDAFMAYESYGEFCERFQTIPCNDNNFMVDQDRDTRSLSSHGTKDTFSTSPAVGKMNRGCERLNPLSVTRACSWHSKWAENIVKSRTFKRLSIFLILLHCTISAVGTTDWVTENVRREQQFDTMKEIFVWVMTLEVMFQCLAHGLFFFVDGWVLFDLIVIGLSWTFNSLLVIRTFRVVRTLRYVNGEFLSIFHPNSNITLTFVVAAPLL